MLTVILLKVIHKLLGFKNDNIPSEPEPVVVVVVVDAAMHVRVGQKSGFHY